MPSRMWFGVAGAITLALVSALVYAFNYHSDVAEATLSEVDIIVGVDVDPTGNTATSVGAIDRCISVNPTDTFYIDLFVKDVTNLNKWEGTFSFDGSVLGVTALDTAYFLDQNQPDSNLWTILDCYTDECTVGAFDQTGAGYDGSGVLGRLELTALAPGRSKAYFTWPVGVSGVILKDASQPPLAIGDVDGDVDRDGYLDGYLDGYFDGLVFNAIVVVDEPCPIDADLDGFTNVEESIDGSDLLDAASTPEMCDDADNDLDSLTDEWYDRNPVNTIPDCIDALSDTDGDLEDNTIDLDDDNDGYSDEMEAYLATDSLDDCADNEYHSAWPLDFNNDKSITVVGDVLNYRGLVASEYGDGNFRTRLDLNMDYNLTVVGDVLAFRGHIAEMCS